MKAIFAVTILTVFVTIVRTSEAVTCPPENEEFVTLVPNPLDCTTFYICDKGVAYLRKCSPGLHFNPVEKVCDWPEHANCEQNPPTESPETTPETEATTETAPETEATTESHEPTSAPETTFVPELTT
ncbi:peritrophin-1-like [Hylaeus anthracinus]|uniref:peritrophin-1-like n=1 Tax=Hylaeus anthracinus TaxID=313031 RepID=UPI0023B8C473|nr:peritrophin-1-like [Hylaeus anthracinus]